MRLRFDNGMELRCTPGHRDLHDEPRLRRGRRADVRRPGHVARPAGAGGERRLDASGDERRRRVSRQGRRSRRAARSRERGPTSSPTTSVGSSATGRIARRRRPRPSTARPRRSATRCCPRTTTLLAWINGDRPLKVSVQANGTVQLRLQPPGVQALPRGARRRLGDAVSTRSCRGRSNRRRPTSSPRSSGAVRRRRLRGPQRREGLATSGSARSRRSCCGGAAAAVDVRHHQRGSTRTVRGRVGVHVRARAMAPSSAYDRRPSYDLRISGAFARHVRGRDRVRLCPQGSDVAFGDRRADPRLLQRRTRRSG